MALHRAAASQRCVVHRLSQEMVWMIRSGKPSPVTRTVIVGAGIVGAALADQLVARRGGEVVLIDRSCPGLGTSRTSFGWLNANKKQPRAYFDLSVEAMRDWSRLAREFGEPSWYQPVGNLAWARSPRARKELAERVDRLQAWGYRAEIVTASHARRLEPNVRIPSDAEIAFSPMRDTSVVARQRRRLFTELPPSAHNSSPTRKSASSS